MKSSNLTSFIILGALAIGVVVFWIINATSKPSEVNVVNNTDNNVNENVTQQPEDIETPDVSKLNSLDLSSQGLEKLPSYVLSRTGLEELDISNNKLTDALPSEMGKLKKLKVLNASNNLMTGVPAEIGHLPDLEVLDLSNNKLTGLPYELANLKKLRVFNISGNDYSELDLDIIKKGLSPEVTIITE